MSNKLTDKPTSDTQPSTLVAIIGGAVKLLNWSGLITLLNALYVPLGRTINGHALNANVTITKSDVSLGNVTNDAQLKAADLDTDVTLAANSDTKIPSQKAVKAYADSAAAAAAAAVVDSSPSTLNTLNELAAALGDDASFAATVATSLGNKQDKSTLGSDVATAVHAATGKSTPVDGDELLIADSAASYALKKLTWANLKATLKTYFDTIYAAATHASRHKSGGADAIKLDELAAPTDVTTLNATTSAHGLLPKLGGGTTNFLRADGTWAAPAGGGGGSALVRGSGQLKGNTTPHGSPTVPSGFINTGFGGGTGTISIEINGTTFVLTFANFDPSDGSTWVDNTAFSGAGDYATAVENWLNGTLAGWVANVVRSEFYITFDGVSTGSSMYLNVTYTMGGVSTSGYTAGTDGADGYGAVTEVEIIPAATGKTTYPVRVFFVSDGAISGMNVQFYLKREGDYYPLCGEIAAYVSSNELLCGLALTIAPYAVRWVNGLYEGSLVAKLIGAPTDGGTLTGYAICEQN